MFCTDCGKSIPVNSAFCVGCGKPVPRGEIKNIPAIDFNKKWWLRLAIVIYIGLYISLPFALVGVWVDNSPESYYNSYLRTWQQNGSYGEAFWYTLLTLIIWIVVLRIMKITFLYIVFAQKLQWRLEFKKFF